jgi:hypothetical protein
VDSEVLRTDSERNFTCILSPSLFIINSQLSSSYHTHSVRNVCSSFYFSGRPNHAQFSYALSVIPEEQALRNHDLSAGQMFELKIQLDKANAVSSRILTYIFVPLKDGRHGFGIQLLSYTHPGYGCKPLYTYKTCDPKECSVYSLCNLEGHKCLHAFNNF